MRRILVYGVTGSGKSTLARRIGERLGLPYHPVDDLMWAANWVPVPPEEQRERITAICATDAWVLDSAYGIWVDVPLARADLIVCLDLPRWRSFGRLLRRSLGNLIHHRETCNGNHETVRQTFASRDSILWWHCQSFKRKQRRMRAWRGNPAMPEVVLLRTPAEVQRWVAGLSGARQP